MANMFQEEWRIAGKIPAKGLSCCCCSKSKYTNNNFLSSLDELISLLFGIFSENEGDMAKKDEIFLASAELVRKVLSRARIQKGVICFSFPRKTRGRRPNLPICCTVKLKPGIPTKLYCNEWIS